MNYYNYLFTFFPYQMLCIKIKKPLSVMLDLHHVLKASITVVKKNGI